MPQEVIIALISAGTGALIAFIGNLITQLIMISREKEKEKKHDKDTLLGKKEEAYLNALEVLLFIKIGFDITREQMINNPGLAKEMSKKSEELNNLSPKIKLYSSDEVFNKFNALKDRYQKFSFANDDGWRLFEESKNSFLEEINNLSRSMRSDLGFSELEK